MRRQTAFAIGLLGLVCAANRASGITDAGTITSVSVTCAPASILAGKTSTCKATVQGTGSYSSVVSWEAAPSSAGTVSPEGVFTSASKQAAIVKVTITATSTHDHTKSGSAVVAVTPKPAITSVSLAASSLSIVTGQTDTLTPTVKGEWNYANTVNLTVSPSAAGTLSASIAVSSGTHVTFTPAALDETTKVTIAAISTEDHSRSSSVAVTVTPSPIKSVSVSCNPATVQDGQTSQCTAVVQGTGSFDATVKWTASLGSVVSTGTDTATIKAPKYGIGSTTVTATSSQDSSRLGRATLTVMRAPPSGSWQPSGPQGGNATVLAEDPSSSGTIYAGSSYASSGSLWKSRNGGKSWQSLDTNSALDYSPISDLAVIDGGQTIYAADCHGPDFYFSTDGGGTWAEVQAGPSGSSIGGMSVDPKSPATVYLSAAGTGVLKSVNGGRNWAALASSPVIAAGSLPAILHSPIQVDPTNTGTVYYGTDHGLYITRNGGTTWVASTNGIASKDSTVWDLAVDPADPSSVFVLAGSASNAAVDLYRSTNGGRSWAPLATGLDAARIVPDPVNPSSIYLYGLQFHVAYKSGDGGHTFTPSDAGTPSAGSSGGSSNGIVLSGPTGAMIALRSSPDALLLTFPVTGIYRSGDSAQSWSFSSDGFSLWNGIAVTFDPEKPATVYFGAMNYGGIFKSTDSGITWANLRSGDSVSNIAVDPFDSTHILAATYEEGLIESRDGGVTWSNRDSALPPPLTGEALINGLNFHPRKQGTIFISTDFGGIGLLRSTDGGKSYKTANTGLPSTNDVGGAIAFNPLDAETLLISFYGEGSAPGGSAKSTDGGNSWTVKSEVQGPFSVDAKSNPPVVYAPGARSADFGETWTTANNGSFLLADPSTANSVFSLNSWSADGGTTWMPLLDDGLGQSHLTPYGWNGQNSGFALAPSDPQVLFVTSFTNSVFRFVVGP